MTQAADDFALVKDTVEWASVCQDAPLGAMDAFNRLFTPRPLRDLIESDCRQMFIKWKFPGHTTADWWVASYYNGRLWWPGSLSGDRPEVYLHAEAIAIPILSPEDMGIGL